MSQTEPGQESSSAENPTPEPAPVPAPKPRAFPLRMNRTAPPASAQPASAQAAPAPAEPAQAEPAPEAKTPKKPRSSRKQAAEAAPQESAVAETAPALTAETATRAPKKDRLNESLLYLLWVESFLFLLAAITALVNILVLAVSRTVEVAPTVSEHIFLASLYQSVARATTTVLCPLFLINVAMAPASFFVLTGKLASTTPRETLGHLLNLIVALFLGAMAFFFFVATDFRSERLRFLF
jgi:hypothetical protein